jgi:hypothetical protein
MPEFKKSDGFKMKRGSKPNFKDLGSSPTKFDWGKAIGTGAQVGLTHAMGPMGMVYGSAIKRQLDGTAKNERQYADVLEQEGLKRNFWGKLGFGGKRARARKARIEELQNQDAAGIDRERIMAREGEAPAGPGAE